MMLCPGLLNHKIVKVVYEDKTHQEAQYRIIRDKGWTRHICEILRNLNSHMMNMIKIAFVDCFAACACAEAEADAALLYGGYGYGTGLGYAGLGYGAGLG